MKLKKIFIVVLTLIAIVLISREIIYNTLYPLKYKDYILKYSKENGLDPYLVMSVINTESKFNKDVASKKQAIGLMQLTEPTAEWIAKSMNDINFKSEDLFDPEKNIKMGCWYLKNLQEEFGTTELVLAAYNAGRGNVSKWLNNSDISKDGKNLHNIPYGETDKYIKKVKVNYNIYKLLYKT
ncbi:lytic transglycosylase domain-containing protein [Clostridium sp. YIM B02551]|uniref:lytic transglycosylase domain-containing protein n=1 Tax=Clostridium sp. YIM B02551 TaxID=2910679 RepID=UPI001EEBB837|nr:lytic transglycosylase domain-containing protein [Clostridium sp. YIM B02551]